MKKLKKNNNKNTMSVTIVFNFSYQQNILENIFLKYLPYHKFFILHSDEFCYKFEKTSHIVQYIITHSNIYFYKQVNISLLLENHTIYSVKFNLFRNLLRFDNYVSDLLERFKNIKIQKNIPIYNVKNYISIHLVDFLNNNTYLSIYKSYPNITCIQINSDKYVFPTIEVPETLLTNIVEYYMNENIYLQIKLNNKTMISYVKDKKNDRENSQYILKHFTLSKNMLNEFHRYFLDKKASIIQQQAVKSMYDNKYQLCRSICKHVCFNVLNLKN